MKMHAADNQPTLPACGVKRGLGIPSFGKNEFRNGETPLPARKMRTLPESLCTRPGERSGY
jgi:hypothetical protein